MEKAINPGKPKAPPKPKAAPKPKQAKAPKAAKPAKSSSSRSSAGSKPKAPPKPKAPAKPKTSSSKASSTAAKAQAKAQQQAAKQKAAADKAAAKQAADKAKADAAAKKAAAQQVKTNTRNVGARAALAQRGVNPTKLGLTAERSGGTVQLAAANLTTAQRDKLAPTAMDDKSYPIPSVLYLRKAIQSFGRCPESKRPALVEHIRTRAKALGASDLDWVKNFLAAHSA